MSKTPNAAHALKAKEPFLRMVKRENLPKTQAVLIRVLAILGSLVFGGLLILALGHNPVAVYADMIKGSLGGVTVLKETIRIAIPLLIAALAISLAFRMRFWNIGAEGQILVGAIAASYFALFAYDSLPSWLLLIVMGLAGIVAGGLYGLLPAIFRARWNTNETLFTLMLNYIALCLLKYLQSGLWKDPAMRGFPKIAMFDAAARLPKVFGVHIGWIIAVFLVVAVYVYLTRTKHGYEIAVVGESSNTARYAGIKVGRVMMRTMVISGALSGLVGFLQVSGADYTLTEMTAGGTGFTAITVAWMSKLNPFLMVVVSFFIAVLEKGAGRIQTTFKIPSSAADVLTGILLFFLLGCEFFINYRLVFRKKGEKKHG
jgi:ABC-type uncharacterized transport system permease subunit